jgi:exodeoxyribonuclease-3
MKIISWNVNGIRAVHRKNLLVPFITEHNPDIICFQETKAQQSESPVDLAQYHEYWNSAEKKGYSGTAIFTKEKPVSITYGFSELIHKKYHFKDSFGDTTTEGRIMTAEYEKFFLVNVYTPNAKDDLGRLSMRYDNWDPAFLEHCNNLEKQKPVIMCGDFNVAHTEDDLARPKPNIGKKGFTHEERIGIDNIIASGFVDTFRLFTQGNGHYTWWSHFGKSRERNVGWRIDYFFASRTIVPKIQRADILADVLGSDHCPASLEIDLE